MLIWNPWHGKTDKHLQVEGTVLALGLYPTLKPVILYILISEVFLLHFSFSCFHM